MKKNMGNTDRLIRIAIAAVLLVGSLMDLFPSTLNIVALIVAAMLILTSFTTFCGLYAIFGWNTCKIKS
jgi:divalent metal cation (Fe/Co/Zn/Cd) transporter